MRERRCAVQSDHQVSGHGGLSRDDVGKQIGEGAVLVDGGPEVIDRAAQLLSDSAERLGQGRPAFLVMFAAGRRTRPGAVA